MDEVSGNEEMNRRWFPIDDEKTWPIDSSGWRSKAPYVLFSGGIILVILGVFFDTLSQ